MRCCARHLPEGEISIERDRTPPNDVSGVVGRIDGL